ncbi:purine-nucleoside phosphorylase [[Clostridium] polysaccharolyticum]|uniref:Purine nucleoside phosphorylase n=1 Tax=[Clostridium] polysaccharolyticum TaxID=29364 RepID=A0A1H9ZT51_9FIRM|nr:purine-nucleoside phosphorylase [[Clostridium] polysaccharolyticum]SES84858.1 purine-nucleoside phosphorylase [[Clostridium] polysaccharolyticum]
MYDKLVKCFETIRGHTRFQPLVGIVLGSGLGDVMQNVKIEKVIPYWEIEDFPISTVEGHKGQFILGYIEDIPVIIMQGRVHYYEGYDIQEVVLPIRIMRMMGAEYLILTNSAGGVNFSYHPGQIVLVKDHIASFVPNCLRGRNIEKLGIRFPDMGEIYHKKLRHLATQVGKRMGLELEEGIYLQTSGPSFESPAEIRMYRMMGADLVGMSSACEAIAAKHAGMKICCFSCVSNMAAGMTDNELTMEEVSVNSRKIENILSKVIFDLVIEIGKE